MYLKCNECGYTFYVTGDSRQAIPFVVIDDYYYCTWCYEEGKF